MGSQEVQGPAKGRVDELGQSLASSSTKRRIAGLVTLRQLLTEDDVPGSVFEATIDCLFRTYPYYIDRPSRGAVQDVLQNHRLYPPYTVYLIERYSQECSKNGLASANAVVLLQWGFLILCRVTKTLAEFKSYGRGLVTSMAQVLDTCLKEKAKDRSSIKQRAVMIAERSTGIVCKSQPDAVVQGIIESLTTKTSALGPRAAPLLGAFAKAVSPESSIVASLKSQLYGFYTREILGSRTLVPVQIASGLKPFFLRFTTIDEFRREIVPSLERSLLRSPEVVLHSVIAPLIHSVSTQLDLTDVLYVNLMKPLLTSIKSQNESIRNGAVSAYKSFMTRCRSENGFHKISQHHLDILSQSKAVSERHCVAKMLQTTPCVRSQSLSACQILSKITSKETSESALAAELDALFQNLHKLPSDSAVPSSLTDAISKGTKDKKPQTRRLWALAVGDYLWQSARVAPPHGFENALDKACSLALQISFDELLQNPLAAAQNGLAIGGYIVTALTSGTSQPEPIGKESRSKPATSLAMSEGPQSFLLNPRVYSKMEQEDITWLTRALVACAGNLADASESARTAWGQAFAYSICAHVPPKVRRAAVEQLAETYLRDRPLIGDAIIKSLWQWHNDAANDRKDTAATLGKTDNRHLLSVLRCICPPASTTRSRTSDSDTKAQENQLMNMLVLCRPEIIPGAHWIDMSLVAGVDPGLLVQERATDCMQVIEGCLEVGNVDERASGTYTASLNTAAELAFVAPNSIIPLLNDRIQQALSPKELLEIGPTELAIARTPEGTPFVDVLSNQAQKLPTHKNTPKYEITRWEEEMRSKIAQRNGQEKKLTADEKNKVNAQLEKESEIRKEIAIVAQRMRLGAGYVHALAKGPPTDPKVWLGTSLTALLGVIAAGAGKLIGQEADDAYLTCADLMTPRLGFQKRFVGIATLRAEGSSTIPESLLYEPLQNLVTRMLHRLHFLSSQRPLDLISLTYALPLVFAVLRRSGIGQCDEETADEQITLGLEIVEFHTEEFADPFLPRRDMLGILLSSMHSYTQHYKLIRDCLMGISSAIASSIEDAETKILLQGAIAPEQNVRAASLQAIRDHIDLTEMDFCEEIWIAYHDDIQENAHLGQIIWQDNALDVDPTNASSIVPYLQRPALSTQSAASKALAACIGHDNPTFTQTLHQLELQYRELAKPKAPEKDAFGMPKKMDLADHWQQRRGLALAFKELAPIFEPTELVAFIDFLLNDAAVGDRNPTVRDKMVESAVGVIALHGASQLGGLMQRFEAYLEASKKDAAASDLVSEAVVILYGSLARHLPNEDAKVPQVVSKLLSTLATPSETVQYAVANCLPPLVRTSITKTSEYIQTTLDTLLQSKRYAARRGAAYGLAGIVKGRGVSALKEYRLMVSLKTAIENKRDQHQRQGALFAYELLALLLGQIFEPYIIQIVPQLLASFGDSSADVREACLDASKTCFSNLSSYGVKIILPTLLEGLEDSQWRSKRGACNLLGAMAYLDPQQLAVSLPDIIPPLTNVLNDSHKEVRAAANRSLQRFGEVISNPEVKGLVNILLKALSDPTKYTEDALEALIKVSFVHYLDSPSLALIVRILQRGLSDRSQTKRKSAQIIGSLAHLTERKDVVSHLPILVTGLRSAIVDPVPATRATASKALGSLVEKLGEDALPDLIPSLMTTLKSDTGAGDRLGSAQALSEVLAGLGTSRLEETLPTVLQNAASIKPSVREGFMSLFIYLPACFGNSFVSYLSRVIPPILSGLADEVEPIRETALRAGRLLVKNFATKSIDLLLPELERGLADNNYHIRLSSVELVGDLLFNLTGISGNTEEQEEEHAAPEAGQSLLEVLGEEKRNKILSSLYICRCDTSGLVKGAAMNVWKALVSTPRTLKELVPTLSQLIIRRLASTNMEQKVIAGNALGELIRKAGESVLSSLLPTLEEGLKTSTDADQRQGICIALREITAAASREALEYYEKTLIGVLRIALVDIDSEVREAAAEAFDSLQQILGKKAVDQVLPYLLSLLRSDEDADVALSALLTLLTDNTRSNIILPNLVPTLLVSPVGAFNARAIASLSKVAGPAMNRRLPNILNTLMDNIVACKDEELRNVLEESFDAITLSVDEFDGLNTLVSVMLALVKNADHHKRANTCTRLSKFFATSAIDFSRYYQDLIRVLLISFDDPDTEVVKAAWQALSGLTQRLRKEEMESLVLSTRHILQQVGVAGANLPGFLLPKGINAILPIFLQGLMNGTADQKTNAALAISEIVDRTSVEALKPFTTQIAGPLIRVVSERSADVKAAILLTLNNILEKVSILLKPFLPQLQRTFAKCLADPTSEMLRARAARALGRLITLTPRVDPLIAELVTGSKAPDRGVQNAMLKALFEVISKAGSNMSETSRTSILNLVSSSGDIEASSGSDLTATTYARLFGALIKSFPEGTSPAPLLKTRALVMNITPSSILNLNSVLLQAPAALLDSLSQETANVIIAGMNSKSTFITDNAVLAAGKYLLTSSARLSATSSSIISTLANLIPPGGSVDTRRLALVVIRTVSRSDPSLTHPQLSVLAPPIFASVRDPVIPVKLAAEAAFVQLFNVVEQESDLFNRYMKEEGEKLNATQKRSMTDYFRRVAVRLGEQARERKEAEGGEGGLGLSNDEVEDEKEIWSVGRMELADKTFSID